MHEACTVHPQTLLSVDALFTSAVKPSDTTPLLALGAHADHKGKDNYSHYRVIKLPFCV